MNSMMCVFPKAFVLSSILTFLFHVQVSLGGLQPSAGILNSGRIEKWFIYFHHFSRHVPHFVVHTVPIFNAA